MSFSNHIQFVFNWSNKIIKVIIHAKINGNFGLLLPINLQAKQQPKL